MKVDKIPQVMRSAGYFLILAAPVIVAQKQCSMGNTNRYKTEIKAKANPAHFAAMEKEAQNKGFTAEEHYWFKKLREVEDSLKMDSVAKKSYFEGAQMVRDSINEKERIVGGK